MKIGLEHKRAVENSERVLLLVRRICSEEYHILEAHGSAESRQGRARHDARPAELLCWEAGGGPWVLGFGSQRTGLRRRGRGCGQGCCVVRYFPVKTLS